MSSELSLTLDKEGTGTAYDKALREDKGPIHTKWKVITKKDGTVEGNPIVMIRIGNQTAVVTARQFLEAAAAIGGAHPGCGERSWPEAPPDTIIKGFHRGVEWQALLVEKMYIVTADCAKGSIQIAGDEAAAKGLAESLIDRITSKG